MIKIRYKYCSTFQTHLGHFSNNGFKSSGLSFLLLLMQIRIYSLSEDHEILLKKFTVWVLNSMTFIQYQKSKWCHTKKANILQYNFIRCHNHRIYAFLPTILLLIYKRSKPRPFTVIANVGQDRYLYRWETLNVHNRSYGLAQKLAAQFNKQSFKQSYQILSHALWKLLKQLWWS